MELARTIKNKALDLGFHLAGITSADPIDRTHIRALARWIEDGHAADMEYMRRNFEKRVSPSLLLENAKSVICLALQYKPAQPASPRCKARIANFALYEDYHPFIKDRLVQLAAFIQTLLPSGTDWNYKACVDTAPLAERALAARAGLGFIGKNHMLIHPALGGQLLLGELITTLPLAPDAPMDINPCINCGLCLRACPTHALHEDGTFCTSRCISYLTQYPGDLSAFAEAIGPRLYGCDTCLLACPYERQAPPCKPSDFRFCPDRTRLDPAEILSLDQQLFKERFRHACIEEIGLERLRRNARICAQNTSAEA